VGGGNGSSHGADLTVSGGLLEIFGLGRIGSGGILADNHGITTYLNGNLSFVNPLNMPPNVLGGVFDDAGNRLESFQIIFDDALQPFEHIPSFWLYTNGAYRRFDNVIADSLGNVFVWLTEAPTDPPILIPPSNNDNDNNVRVPIPAPQAPSQGLWIQTGANANQGLILQLKGVHTGILGGENGDLAVLIDVREESGIPISKQLDYLDHALDIVNAQRAQLGAIQNRLEFTRQSLDISSENLLSAESRIRDTDMANEAMNYAKYSILADSSSAFIAQANNFPQGVLQVLR
jgi:hypothetical protein